MPRISVIVPVYKVENYLSACLDSILAQTFPDFELILVDDGSPDHCPAICEAYAARDPRVRVIHQENRSLSGARNRGISESTGEYLCFVDSDDLVASDYLEYLLDLLTNLGGDFSVCGALRFTREAELSAFGATALPPRYISAVAFFEKQLGPETEMGVWNKLFRREVFNSLRFEEGKLHEDVLFSVELAETCCRGVAWGREEKYFYRQNPQGIMGRSRKRIHPDRIYAGERVIRYGKARGGQEENACLIYALEYPWMMVDGIYVRREFRENREFLIRLQRQIRDNLPQIQELAHFSPIVKFRMALFARSRVLYGINAWARLLRVYVYRLLHLDAYADGHGI